MDHLAILDTYLGHRQSLLQVQSSLESSEVIPPSFPPLHPNQRHGDIQTTSSSSSLSSTSSTSPSNTKNISPRPSSASSSVDSIPHAAIDSTPPCILKILPVLIQSQTTMHQLRVHIRTFQSLYVQQQLPSYKQLVTEEILPLFRSIHDQFGTLYSLYQDLRTLSNTSPNPSSSSSSFLHHHFFPLECKLALFLVNTYTRYYQSLGILLYLLAIDMDQQLLKNGYYISLTLSAKASTTTAHLSQPSGSDSRSLPNHHTTATRSNSTTTTTESSSVVSSMFPSITDTDALRFTETIECLTYLQCIYESCFKSMNILHDSFLLYTLNETENSKTRDNENDDQISHDDIPVSSVQHPRWLLDNSLIEDTVVARIEIFTHQKHDFFRKQGTVARSPIRYTVTWSLVHYWLRPSLGDGQNNTTEKPMYRFPIYETVNTLSKYTVPWRIWIMLFPIFTLYHDYTQFIKEKLTPSPSLTKETEVGEDEIAKESKETMDNDDESTSNVTKGEPPESSSTTVSVYVDGCDWESSIPLPMKGYKNENTNELSIITSSLFFVSWYKDIFQPSSYFTTWLHLYETTIFSSFPSLSSSLSSLLVNNNSPKVLSPSSNNLSFLLGNEGKVSASSFRYVLEYITVMFISLSFAAPLTDFSSVDTAGLLHPTNALATLKYPSPLKHHYSYYLFTDKGKLVVDIQEELHQLDQYIYQRYPHRSVFLGTGVWKNCSYHTFPALSVLLSIRKKLFSRLYTKVTESIWSMHSEKNLLRIVQNQLSMESSQALAEYCYRPILDYIRYHRSRLIHPSASDSTLSCSIYQEVCIVPIVTTLINCTVYGTLHYLEEHVNKHQLYTKSKNVSSRLHQSLGSFRIGTLYNANKHGGVSSSILQNEETLLHLLDTVYPLPEWPNIGTAQTTGVLSNTPDKGTKRIAHVSSYPILSVAPGISANDTSDGHESFVVPNHTKPPHGSRSSLSSFGVRNLVENVFQGLSKVAVKTFERWDRGDESDDHHQTNEDRVVHSDERILQSTNEETREGSNRKQYNDTTMRTASLLPHESVNGTLISSPFDDLWSRLVPSLCRSEQGILYDFSHTINWLSSFEPPTEENPSTATGIEIVSTAKLLEYFVRTVYILDNLTTNMNEWFVTLIRPYDTYGTKYIEKELIIYSSRIVRLRTYLYRTIMRNVVLKFLVSSLSWLTYVMQRINQPELRNPPLGNGPTVQEQIIYSNVQEMVWQSRLWLCRLQTLYSTTNEGNMDPSNTLLVKEWYKIMDKCIVTILDNEIIPPNRTTLITSEMYAYIQKQLRYLSIHGTDSSKWIATVGSTYSIHFPLVDHWYQEKCRKDKNNQNGEEEKKKEMDRSHTE